MKDPIRFVDIDADADVDPDDILMLTLIGSSSIRYIVLFMYAAKKLGFEDVFTKSLVNLRST